MEPCTSDIPCAMMMVNNAIDYVTWLVFNLQPEIDFLNISSKDIAKLCTHLHPPPPSSFQPPPSSLQHPQQYLNQNIARNWAISPNLGRKTKCCPLWLKIGSHDIVEMLIPNPELDFWNSDPNINFWANLGPKIQSCSFCLKIGAHNISKMLIPNPDLDF